MMIYMLFWVAREDIVGFIAPHTPDPYNILLESLHSLQNSGNHSVFSLSQWCASYFRTVKYIVLQFLYYKYTAFI
jgi:hypothetical protein